MRISPLAWLRRLGFRPIGIGVAAFMLLVTLSAAFLRTRLSGSLPTAKSDVRHHPPWILGRPDAPFTIIEYADLECAYCRAYFPVLERWIKEHPQVKWEWWNLPLATHEPVASREAVLAECVGETDGNRAFWRSVEWIYRHTRSDGAGVSAGTRMPGKSAAIAGCLETGKAEKIIRAQAQEASRQHIPGTPTLRILDRRTGRSLELQGPVAGDSLLSAIDWLDATGSHQMPRAMSR